jgi:hypothetical protein
MNTLLLVITFISVAAAVAALAVVRRLTRAERERSEARVAALAQAVDTHGSPGGGWTSVAGEWQWTPEADMDSLREPAAGAHAAGFVTEEHTTVPPSPDRLFGTVERDDRSGSRLPVFAAAALIVMLGGALVFLNTSGSNQPEATASQADHAEPLELVALGHAHEVRALTISGTVRNPAGGVKVEGLTAVISLLDRNGALVSTKDVPLDYRALAPGEEAPFKVSIPDPGAIARYRVSFRTGADVVPHVDRRVDTKLASALQ